MTVKASMECLVWQDMREAVAQVNPEFACIIDDLDPGPELRLYQAKYPFGVQVLLDHEMYYPNPLGDLVTLDSYTLSSQVKEDLGFITGYNPLSFLLNNQVEIFFDLPEHRHVPIALGITGSILGTWKFIDSSVSGFFWAGTAGARSIFLLPKVSESGAHTRLQKAYKINTDKPVDLYTHWNVFYDLSNSCKQDKKWMLEVLYFSKAWFDHAHNDPNWLQFKHYILNLGWRGTYYSRTYHLFDPLISYVVYKRKLKPSPHLLDVVKHLLFIAMGTAPGFRVAKDNALGPIDFIQKCYLEGYGLKQYAPIMMTPGYFNFLNPHENPIYYTFSYPTTLSFYLKADRKQTTLTTLYHAALLLKKIQDDILDSDFRIKDSLLFQMLKDVKFDFFHTTNQDYSIIYDPAEILKQDTSFMKKWQNTQNNVFPKNSPFFNGCVRISRKR